MLDQIIFTLTKIDRYRANETIFTPVQIYTDPSRIIDKDIAETYSKMNLRAAWTYTKENKIK